MIPVNSYVVQRSIEHYGKDVQSTVCMEEWRNLSKQSVNKNVESQTKTTLPKRWQT